MSQIPSPELRALADEALTIGDVRSAAIFVSGDGAALTLAAATGIEGPPLEGLVAAVRDPRHPVTRAMTDPGPTFDALPMNPGGPKLRSHLPIRACAGPAGSATGVLALAHDAPTTKANRRALMELADRVAAVLRTSLA